MAEQSFGQRIKELREEKKKSDPAFSLRRFALAVGISATFLSKIENGDPAMPSPDKIKKMAELLGCNANDLLALAGRVDPDLAPIIRSKPNVMADLLRTARDLKPPPQMWNDFGVTWNTSVAWSATRRTFLRRKNAYGKKEERPSED